MASFKNQQTRMLSIRGINQHRSFARSIIVRNATPTIIKKKKDEKEGTRRLSARVGQRHCWRMIDDREQIEGT